MKEIFKRIKKSHPDYLIIIKKNGTYIRPDTSGLGHNKK